MPQEEGGCHCAHILPSLGHQRHERVSSLVSHGAECLERLDVAPRVPVACCRIAKPECIRLRGDTCGELLNQLLDSRHGQTPFATFRNTRNRRTTERRTTVCSTI